MTDNAKSYSWTDQYKRSWDVIQEDSQGSISLLQSSQMSADLLEMIELRRKWIERSSGCQRGILRHLYVILDMSKPMAGKDFKPSYLELSISYLKQFIAEFYDQNPISLLGFIGTKDGVAQKLSELSGNPLEHIEMLDSIMDSSMLKGDPSLMNALELARTSLTHVPSNGCKEVLILMASLTSRDPGDVLSTIRRLQQDAIVCNIISLSAEVHICKQICRETEGNYSIALHEDHFKMLMWDRIPPPVLLHEKPATSVRMGFPKRTDQQSLCACHSKLTAEGYTCPQCLSKQCNIPTDCSICSLKLISAPHLARSYHHLFPILPFNEVSLDTVQAGGKCFACTSNFSRRSVAADVDIPKARTAVPSSTTAVTIRLSQDDSKTGMKQHTIGYQCRKCHAIFCLGCDIFIHDTLHNCPGCSS